MKRAKARLSRELRDLLGDQAPVECLDAMTIRLMGEGESLGKTNARIIAEQVMRMARDGDKWAIEFVAERAEGKAVPATDAEETTRIVEEALSDVTRQHINALASAVNPDAPVGANPLVSPEPDRAGNEDDGDAGAKPSGPTSPLLDLPEDGDRRSEDFGG